MPSKWTNKHEAWPRVDSPLPFVLLVGINNYGEIWRGGRCEMRGGIDLLRQVYPDAVPHFPELLPDVDQRIDEWLERHGMFSS